MSYAPAPATYKAIVGSGYDSIDSFYGIKGDEIKAELKEAGLKPGHVNKIAARVTKHSAQPPQVPEGSGAAGNESL